jgi:hypothetical protein
METRQFGNSITNTFQDTTQSTQLKATKQEWFVPTKLPVKKSEFSHFSSRFKTKIADCEVFGLAYNRDGALYAAALQDGQL